MLQKCWDFFSSPLFHSFLVLPFSVALFCLFLSCTDNEVSWARIAAHYCFRGHCMSACKLQNNTVGLGLPKRGEKRVSEVQRAVWIKHCGVHGKTGEKAKKETIRKWELPNAWLPFLGGTCTRSPITVILVHCSIVQLSRYILYASLQMRSRNSVFLSVLACCH